ncbi:hypothetical protein Cpir12675_003864 [Ceratocystis pirilliformis]|uniref:BZIP domain-containing protein n=1 Tax=Ceratocystis pirilliformis TaxID=259994 RepID=A0ABR3Z1B1_9PEZI
MTGSRASGGPGTVVGTNSEKFASSSTTKASIKKQPLLKLNTQNIAPLPAKASKPSSSNHQLLQRPPIIAIRPSPAPQLSLAPSSSTASTPTGSVVGHTATPINVSSSNQPIKTKMSMAAMVTPDPHQPSVHQHVPPTPVVPAAPKVARIGAPKTTITSKEWIIPPRPKPGRKPATDTPPSKRKAQNRAAQRAFRERRAARVGELEEQIEDHKQVRDAVESELRERIHGLELELQSFRSRCSLLENMLERERQERIRVETSSGLLQQQQQQQQQKQQQQSYHRHAEPRKSGDSHFAVSSADFGSSSAMDLGSSSHGCPSTDPSTPNPAISTGYDGVKILMEDHRSPSSFAMSSILPPPNAASVGASGTIDLASLSCGGCQPDGPCACVEEALAHVDAQAESNCAKCGTLSSSCSCARLGLSSEIHMQQHQAPKRALSPQFDGMNKRPQPHSITSTSEIEVDMTNIWKKEPLPSLQSSHSLPKITIAPKDKCGFCDTDESCCVCANPDLVSGPPMDYIPEPSSLSISVPDLASAQPRRSVYQAPSPPGSEASPPPMEITSTGAVKLRPFNKKSAAPAAMSKTLPKPASFGGCGPNGPGTCAQCKADPKSGLFCRSLAANFERASGSGSGGCCGGGGPGGGCCKSKMPALTPASSSSSSSTKPPISMSASSIAAKAQFGLNLSCADTYKTLASHRNFDQAADEISTWLPKLRATVRHSGGSPSLGSAAGERDNGGSGDSQQKRLPIEVEAASIMSVLKDFDVRFQGQLPPP